MYPPELKSRLLTAPFEKVALLWEALETEGGDAAKRWLAQNDRYYLLVRLLHRTDAIHPWLYARTREVEQQPNGYLDLWAREHYKALATDTPILTPTGYKPHGSLMPGDWVYGSDGVPTQVVATTPVFTDDECYKVWFDDATEIVAGAEHLWTIETKDRSRVTGTNKRKGWKTVTVPTKELSLHQGRSRIKTAPPIFNAEHMVPVGPYTLGAWLGDGNNDSGRITCGDPEVFEAIRSEGYTHKPDTPDVTCQSHTLYGLSATLRGMGVLHNKHVPPEYLMGSVSQRRAVLQGLMDTDGHCNDRGTCIFVNKHEPLASSVFDLCVSLGLKPTRNYFDYEHGRVYHVTFQGYLEDAPFRIPRKLARCKTTSRVNSAYRYLWGVKRTDTVPTSCIQVAAPDGLYLCGRQCVTTHNSTIITFAGIIQEVLREPTITIGLFSHTKPIAKAFLRQIQQEFENNKDLTDLFPEIFYENPTRESSSWSLDNGLTVKRSSNSKEATISAHGLVDGQPIGMHFRLMVYDDVVTTESVATPEQIAKTTAAWEMSDNLGSASDGRKWHVGTRYSYADTYETMIQRKSVIVRLHPATDDGTITGDPVLFTKELWLRKVRDQGEATISCQMLQNPLAGQQRMFNVEDLREYEIRPETLNIYIMVDPARSKKKGSDKTAVAVVGVDYSMNKYLLDGFNHKMDLRERWLRTAQMYHKWKRSPGVQNIKVGYEAFGAQADLDYFKEQMQKSNEGGHFNIEELKWSHDTDGSKVDRVQRLGPDVRAHKIYVPYPTNPDMLTKVQRNMENTGYRHRIATPIRRKDESNAIYDLSKEFKLQVHFFPFSGKKDLIDAFSRIYDMEPHAPSFREPSYLEPEYV